YLLNRCCGCEECRRRGDAVAEYEADFRHGRERRNRWRHVAQAGSLWPGAQERRGPGAHSAGVAGRHIAAVLPHQALRRHGSDGRMSLTTVVLSESKLLLPTYDRQRVLFERGRGVYLWDSKGKRYLDF